MLKQVISDNFPILINAKRRLPPDNCIFAKNINRMHHWRIHILDGDCLEHFKNATF